MDRRVQDDGTVIVGGQVVPTGGATPTIASVVSVTPVGNIQSTNVQGALQELDGEKAPTVHTHDDRYFTEVEVTNLLASKSDTSHTHDTRYYTESEVDAKIVVINNAIAGKAPTVHDHDDRYYTEAEVDAKIAAALATTENHENARFDIVEMSTDGPGADIVTSRLYPTGWGNYWGNGAAGANRPQLSADNTVRHDTSGYSLKMVLPATDSGQTMNSSVFAVTPGSIVTVSAWVKGTGAATAPYALLTLLSNSTDPDFFVGGNQTVDTSNVIPGASWQQLSVSMVIPAGHTRCRFMLRGYASGITNAAPGTLWWDDTSSRVQVIPASGVVTGEMKEYPAGTAPSGYLEANGGSFSATTYPGLAALYGDKYGTHSGDTYYLPRKARKLPDTDWINATLGSGWTNYGAGYPPARYRRVNGEVHVEGLVAAPGAAVPAIMNLGVGFRRNYRHIYAPSHAVLTDMARVDVDSNGDVIYMNGNPAFISLDAIAPFQAEDVAGTIMTIIKAA